MASSSSSAAGVRTEKIVVLPESAEFEAQIRTSMEAISTNNAAVEAAFHGLIETHPDFLALHFAALLSLPATPADSRGMQATTLRQLFSRSPLWSRMSAAARETVKACLLQALESAPDSRDIWDVVTALAASLLPDPGSSWDELMIYLIEASSGQGPQLQESVLMLFTQVNMGEASDDYSNSIIGILERSLQHTTSPHVRITALGATASIAQYLSTDEARQKLQYLLCFMTNALNDCANPINEASSSVAVNLLLRLSCTDASFLDPWIDELAEGMLEIAEAKQANATKIIALEFLVHVAERAGILMKLERSRGTAQQLPKFMERLVRLLMLMLIDVEDNSLMQIAESHGDAAEVNGYCLAQISLHRLANAFGDQFVPIIAVFLQECFSAPELEWKKHCAALIALSQIAKGCAKAMLQNLDKMVAIILEGFKDPHPAVQWAAIKAIGGLSTDLSPNLQVHYHHLIVPALVSAMGGSQSPLVKELAASTIITFSKKCSNAILAQYLSQVCSQLNVLCRGKQIAGGERLSSSDSVATPPSPPPSPAPAPSSAKRFKTRHGYKRKSEEPAQPQEPVSEMRPMKGITLVAFLKALSTAAVTATSAIVITVGTVSWPSNPSTISKILLTAMVYYGLPMTAVASALAHAGEHDGRWLSFAIGLLMSQVMFTILVGGGVIAFNHESQDVAVPFTLFTLIAFLIAWDFIFKQPMWLRKLLGWISNRLSPISTSEPVRGLFRWMKQRFTRTPGVHNEGMQAV